jgi:hypothetical protein
MRTSKEELPGSETRTYSRPENYATGLRRRRARKPWKEGRRNDKSSTLQTKKYEQFAMKLTQAHTLDLLAKYGVHVMEACDKCGQILGWIRYTRKNESGEWCSRECRDGTEAHQPRTCRHCRARLPEGKRKGAAFCDDAGRKAAKRQSGVLHMSETVKIIADKTVAFWGFFTGKLKGWYIGLPGGIWKA